MRQYTLKIPGDPVGKQETQVFAGKRKGGSTFRRGVKPEKSVKFQALVKMIAASHDPPIEMMKYAKLTVILHLPMTIAKKRKTLPDAWKPCGRHPDPDNVEKLVRDALEGIAYKNDKVVGGNNDFMDEPPDTQPYTEIIIEEVDRLTRASEAVLAASASGGVELEY